MMPGRTSEENTMRKLLSGVAIVPFLASLALAGQPTQLTDLQMDKVTAGHDFFEITTLNLATVVVSVASGSLVAPAESSASDVTIFGSGPLQIAVIDHNPS